MEYDVTTRTIIVDGEINASQVTDFIEAVIDILNKDIEDEAGKPRKPILVLYNTSGGEIFQAVAMADFMRVTDCEFINVNIRNCASAAIIPFLASDIRYCVKHCMFLVHATRHTLSAVDQRDFDCGYRRSNLANQEIKNVLLEKTLMDPNQIDAIINGTEEPIEMDADLAHKLGIANTINKLKLGPDGWNIECFKIQPMIGSKK